MEGRNTLGGRIGYELKRVQHALRLWMDEALREIGLTTAQYAALSVLEEEPGISGAALARRCFVTPQTMNQVLVNLEGSGLIERRAHPEHGRILQARLTESGERVVRRAHEVVGGIEDRMLSGLSEEEQRQLLEALRSCLDSIEPDTRRYVRGG